MSLANNRIIRQEIQSASDFELDNPRSLVSYLILLYGTDNEELICNELFEEKRKRKVKQLNKEK